MSGALNYHSGLSAEDQVVQHYERAGFKVLERRWRGAGGEIDLILSGGAGTVFVEVKKSKNFEQAAARLGPQQMQRIYASGAEYLGRLPAGQDSPARFDVALVDATGRIEVIENAFGH